MLAGGIMIHSTTIYSGSESITDQSLDEIKKLKVALAFYANKNNYEEKLTTIDLGFGRIQDITSSVKLDAGRLARKTLGEI